MFEFGRGELAALLPFVGLELVRDLKFFEKP